MGCFITMNQRLLFINDVDLSRQIGIARYCHRLILNRIERIIYHPTNTVYAILANERKAKKGGMKEYLDASMILKTNGYSWNKRTNKLVKRNS